MRRHEGDGLGPGAWVVLMGSALWASLLLVVPFAAGHGPLDPARTVVATATYLGGQVVCHQRAERSFHPWGTQMPVCARCAGLYAGAPLGVLLGATGVGARRRARSPRAEGMTPRFRGVLVVTALPTAATVVGEVSGLVEPGNAVRALSAVPLGLGVAWVIGRGVGRSGAGGAG